MKSENEDVERMIWMSHLWGPSCPSYGGGERISITKMHDMALGDTSNALKFSAGNHIGTHIDFPRHFVINGRNAESYGAEELYFKFPLLLDIKLDRTERHILPEHLLKSLDFDLKDSAMCDALILRTGSEKFRNEERYWRDGPGLGLGLGPFLREKMPFCRIVGIDSISITAFSNRELGRVVHREFLDHQEPILLVEDMRLAEAPSGWLKSLMVAPLRIEGADGAPVTVIGQIK